MTRDEAKHYAMGYARGRDAAEADHGKGCCCKNCPWRGDHGWPKVRTAGGCVAFARAFADAHDAFNKGSDKPPPTVDQAWIAWQQSLGKRLS